VPPNILPSISPASTQPIPTVPVLAIATLLDVQSKNEAAGVRRSASLDDKHDLASLLTPQPTLFDLKHFPKEDEENDEDDSDESNGNSIPSGTEPLTEQTDKSKANSSATPATAPSAAPTANELMLERKLQTALRNCKKLEAKLKAQTKMEENLKDECRRFKLDAATAKESVTKVRDLTASNGQLSKKLERVTNERDRLSTKAKMVVDLVQTISTLRDNLTKEKKQSAHLQSQLQQYVGDFNARTLPELETLTKKFTDGLLNVQQAWRTRLDTERKEAHNKTICKICYAADVDCLLLPCCHYISCLQCARRCATCPVCRHEIIDRRPVYS